MKITKKDLEAALDMDINIYGWETTLRDIFYSFITGLWKDESFNGKRPGVDSGWHYCIAEFIYNNLDRSVGKEKKYEDGDVELEITDWKKVDMWYEKLAQQCIWGK